MNYSQLSHAIKDCSNSFDGTVPTTFNLAFGHRFVSFDGTPNLKLILTNIDPALISDAHCYIVNLPYFHLQTLVDRIAAMPFLHSYVRRIEVPVLKLRKSKVINLLAPGTLIASDVYFGHNCIDLTTQYIDRSEADVCLYNPRQSAK